MKPTNPEQRDLLAAEYVLGTLRGPARRRFAHWLVDDTDLRARTAYWAQAFQPMADDIEPITPPATVWAMISGRLGLSSRQDARSGRRAAGPFGWWPVLRAAALGLVIGLGLYVWAPVERPPAFTPDVNVAMVDDAKQPLWRIEADRQHDRVRVVALSDVPVDAGKSLELWLLRDGDQSPVSLGLIPVRKGQAMNVASAAPVRVGVGFAVSVEPAGGSPTGLPTGPVKYVRML